MPITAQELILDLGGLPPLPQVASQVLNLTADPDSNAEDLQRVISTDQALTGQTLKIANSAMFGMVREVSTLSQAIMTLGFSTIKCVVIASSAKTIYNRGASGLQDRLMWDHAFTAAIASRSLARLLRSPRVEEAFLGGLLHDIGKAVLGVKFPDRYGNLIKRVYNGEYPDGAELEFETFGFDHAMVGEALLRAWNLTESLEQVARWHHCPAFAQKDHQSLVAIVALGNAFAIDIKVGIGSLEGLSRPTTEALQILGLTPMEFDGFRDDLLESLERDKGTIREF